MDTARSNMKYIKLVRHGQGYHQIHGLNLLDPHLTEQGRLDALRVNTTAELMISSSMIRTLETAEIIYSNNKLTGPIIVTDLCREGCNLTACNERRPLAELKQIFSSEYFDWSNIQSNLDTMAKTEYRIDKRDEVAVVRSRALRFLKYLEQLSEMNICVVTHQGFIRCILSTILNLDYNHSVPMPQNCSDIAITFSNEVWDLDPTIKDTYIPQVIQ